MDHDSADEALDGAELNSRGWTTGKDAAAVLREIAAQIESFEHLVHCTIQIRFEASTRRKKDAPR